MSRKTLPEALRENAEALRLQAEIQEESAKKLRLKAANLEVNAREVEHLIADNRGLRAKEARKTSGITVFIPALHDGKKVLKEHRKNNAKPTKKGRRP